MLPSFMYLDGNMNAKRGCAWRVTRNLVPRFVHCIYWIPARLRGNDEHGKMSFFKTSPEYSGLVIPTLFGDIGFFIAIRVLFTPRS